MEWNVGVEHGSKHSSTRALFTERTVEYKRLHHRCTSSQVNVVVDVGFAVPADMR